MLVVDILHEFELGVWKSLFIQLIRLLYAVGKSTEIGSETLVTELDARFVYDFLLFVMQFTSLHLQISPNLNFWFWYHSNIFPKFFRNEKTRCSRLRRFTSGVRNFRSIDRFLIQCFSPMRSQCAIPAFEGLLDEPHNRRLMKLLYRTAEWHALAKLRMHTESSLSLLESLTTEFGLLMQNFEELTCSQFATTELPREAAARKRRQLNNSTTTTRPPTNKDSQAGNITVPDREC